VIREICSEARCRARWRAADAGATAASKVRAHGTCARSRWARASTWRNNYMCSRAQAGRSGDHADIPLAGRSSRRGCWPLNRARRALHDGNIRQRLNMPIPRHFARQRHSTMASGALSQGDRMAFANQLDRFWPGPDDGVTRGAARGAPRVVCWHVPQSSGSVDLVPGRIGDFEVVCGRLGLESLGPSSRAPRIHFARILLEIFLVVPRS